jgi:hypothetical protein
MSSSWHFLSKRLPHLRSMKPDQESGAVCRRHQSFPVIDRRELARGISVYQLWGIKEQTKGLLMTTPYSDRA